MKSIAKFAFGVAVLAGAVTMAAAPASARIAVGGGFRPGLLRSPAPAYACDPYYDPYGCGYYGGYYGPGYWGPGGVWIGGRIGGGWAWRRRFPRRLPWRWWFPRRRPSLTPETR